jgi:hypothetical protein
MFVGGTEENHESQRIIGATAKIQTWHLANTSQKGVKRLKQNRYHQARLFILAAIMHGDGACNVYSKIG